MRDDTDRAAESLEPISHRDRLWIDLARLLGRQPALALERVAINELRLDLFHKNEGQKVRAERGEKRLEGKRKIREENAQNNGGRRDKTPPCARPSADRT
jgi:hypothetical protein